MTNITKINRFVIHITINNSDRNRFNTLNQLKSLHYSNKIKSKFYKIFLIR